MKLQLVIIATLVAAAIALPAPKNVYSGIKRQLGVGDNKKESALWKKVAVSHVYD